MKKRLKECNLTHNHGWDINTSLLEMDRSSGKTK